MRKFSILIFIIFYFSLTSLAYTVMPAEKINVIKGYTRAANSMTVTAEVAGRIKEINADMGHVSKGGVFAVIDPVFTELSIKSLKASLGKVEASKARIAESVAYYQKEYNRVEELYKSEVETESRRDAALHALAQAELSLGELDAEKKSILAQLSELKEKLSRHFIHVPKGWSITDKPLEVGELVGVGQPITTAGDFSSMIVPVYLDNEEMRYLADQKSFIIMLEGEEKQAELVRVNPAFDERTRKRHAEIKIEMKGIGGLLVEIPVKLRSDGLMISEKTLINRYSNPRVKIKSTGEEVRVSILSRDKGMVTIAATPELKVGMELEVAAE